MKTRALIIFLALGPVACAGIMEAAQVPVAAPAKDVTIGQLTRLQREWQTAVRDGRYDEANRIYAEWGDALDNASPAAREDPDFAEVEWNHARAHVLAQRVEKVVKLKPKTAEIEDLMYAFRQEAEVNVEVAKTLVMANDRVGQLEQLRMGIERLKQMRRSGRDFEEIEPYRSFSAWEAETIAWLDAKADEAEWAIKAGMLISKEISDGARATQLAKASKDKAERRQHLSTAATSFRKCITVVGEATKAGGYSPDFDLDTPAGRVSLETLKASCRKATAKVTRMKRSTRM